MSGARRARVERPRSQWSRDQRRPSRLLPIAARASARRVTAAATHRRYAEGAWVSCGGSMAATPASAGPAADRHGAYPEECDPCPADLTGGTRDDVSHRSRDREVAVAAGDLLNR